MFGRIRKFLIAGSITVLIWVWADEALTREVTVPATVAVDQSADPRLLVRLNMQSSIGARVRLSGPASKIDALQRRLKEGELKLEFYINPTEEKIDTPGNHTVKLPDLIQRSRLTADMGVQIESTEPETIIVGIDRLVLKPLVVRVVGDNQALLRDAVVEPSTVDMHVPQNWQGDALRATVQLTVPEIEQARSGGILRRPTVEIEGAVKAADMQVNITMSATKQLLKEFVIKETNIGFVFSPNLAGKYKVELINQNEVLGPIKILATDEAARAYREETLFKVILNISDDDRNETGELPREVVFNLPSEYVAKGEIGIAEAEPRIAKFKLLPLETGINDAVTP